MKKITLIFIAAIVFFSAKAQDFNIATDYLSYMTDRQLEISKNLWEYISATAHSKRETKIDLKKEDLLASITQSKKEIAKMPAFENSTTLRDSFVSYLVFSEKLLSGDLYTLENLEIDANNSYEAMLKYLDKIDEINQKYSKKGEMISNEIDKFAAVNSITLINNNSELAKKIQTATVVNSYYNDIFLIYFKAQFIETLIIRAINASDTNLIKQYCDTLTATIKICNQDLMKIEGYNGDLILKFSCQKAINYFKQENDNYFPKIITFYRAKATFEAAKKDYDAKAKKKTVTQPDVDKYNKAVNDYNLAIEQYNDAMAKISATQKDNSKQWEDAVTKFLDKYIPK